MASSPELGRKTKDLDAQPDFLVLAGPDVFPMLLEPKNPTRHAIFARNCMVLGHTRSLRPERRPTRQ